MDKKQQLVFAYSYHRETAAVKHPSDAYDEPETSDEISIGHMYEYGESVPQDYATALHWYQLAATTRDTAAEAGVQRVEQLLSGLSPLRGSK